ANLQERGVVSEFFVTTYEKPSDEVVSRSAPTSAPQTKAPARTNQPALNSAPGDVPGPARPATQKRLDSLPPNSARANSPAPAPAASRSITEAQTSLPVNSATPPVANSSTRPAPNLANDPGSSASVREAPTVTPPRGFLRFRDPKIGYSFD